MSWPPGSTYVPVQSERWSKSRTQDAASEPTTRPRASRRRSVNTSASPAEGPAGAASTTWASWTCERSCRGAGGPWRPVAAKGPAVVATSAAATAAGTARTAVRSMMVRSWTGRDDSPSAGRPVHRGGPDDRAAARRVGDRPARVGDRP